jgi:putative nucleotidyltransferase with HDIG domain
MSEEYRTFFKVFAQVSKAIHSGEQSPEILAQIVTNIKEILGAKGCIYWIIDRSGQKIISSFSHGFSYRSLEEMDYPTLTSLFDRNHGQLTFVEDARNDRRIPDKERLGKRRVGSISGIFFDIVSSLEGILAIYFHDRHELTEEELELVTALGEQGALALQKAISYDEKTMENLRQMVEGLTMALEAKDEQTHGHSVRVARLAKIVAKEMGLSEVEVKTVYHGGLLHDIGKIGMGDEILQRLGILNKNEMDIIRRHPEIGAKITRPLNFLSAVEPLILHHHERFDGSGYPDGLKGRAIPLGARILTACDAFETMLAGRRHLVAMTVEDAAHNLNNEAGRHFDPEVVKALFTALIHAPEVLDLSSDACLSLEKYRQQVRFIAPYNNSCVSF